MPQFAKSSDGVIMFFMFFFDGLIDMFISDQA